VGGIREKLLAGVRTGCTKVVLPAKNQEDVASLSGDVTDISTWFMSIRLTRQSHICLYEFFLFFIVNHDTFVRSMASRENVIPAKAKDLRARSLSLSAIFRFSNSNVLRMPDQISVDFEYGMTDFDFYDSINQKICLSGKTACLADFSPVFSSYHHS